MGLAEGRTFCRETRSTAKPDIARIAMQRPVRIPTSHFPLFLSNALRKVPPSQTRKTNSALFQSTSQFWESQLGKVSDARANRFTIKILNLKSLKTRKDSLRKKISRKWREREQGNCSCRMFCLICRHRNTLSVNLYENRVPVAGTLLWIKIWISMTSQLIKSRRKHFWRSQEKPVW